MKKYFDIKGFIIDIIGFIFLIKISSSLIRESGPGGYNFSNYFKFLFIFFIIQSILIATTNISFLFKKDEKEEIFPVKEILRFLSIVLAIIFFSELAIWLTNIIFIKGELPILLLFLCLSAVSLFLPCFRLRIKAHTKEELNIASSSIAFLIPNLIIYFFWFIAMWMDGLFSS